MALTGVPEQPPTLPRASQLLPFRCIHITDLHAPRIIGILRRLDGGPVSVEESHYTTAFAPDENSFTWQYRNRNYARRFFERSAPQ
jgi:hypothetical protein